MICTLGGSGMSRTCFAIGSNRRVPHGGTVGERERWLMETLVSIVEIGSSTRIRYFQHFVGGRWPCRSSLTKCNG